MGAVFWEDGLAVAGKVVGPPPIVGLEVVGRIVGFLFGFFVRGFLVFGAVVVDEGMSVVVVGVAVGLIVLVMLLLGAPLDGLEETGALVVLGTMDGMGAAVGEAAVLRDDGLAVVGKVVGP